MNKANRVLKILIILIINFLGFHLASHFFPVSASSPNSYCSRDGNTANACTFHFLHQSSGAYFLAAGLKTTNLQSLGYSVSDTNMQTCGGIGTDYDGPDCLADYWFNGNLPASAQNADIIMFKSCFHLVSLGSTSADLTRWKTKYLNRFIYGQGGASCSGSACNGYARSNSNQLIVAMPGIPFDETSYGGKSTLPASDVIENWGEWLKKDFVNIARSKGIYNLVSFDIFDYFADGKSDTAENNGNNLACPEFDKAGDHHLNDFANSCAAGNSGAPSLLSFIDTAANDFFQDKNANSYVPQSYRCTGGCPVIISGTSPTNTPAPTQSCKPGDCDCNGTVNIVDVGIIVDAYGTSPPSDPRADLDHSGTVNIVDLGIAIDNYGL